MLIFGSFARLCMNVEVIQKNLDLVLYGFSSEVKDGRNGEVGVKLMEIMFQTFKAEGLEGDGTNVWVYDDADHMFVGMKLKQEPRRGTLMQRKHVSLKKYAYWKHVGSYDMLKEVNEKMRRTMEESGIKYSSPCLEIYGHWTEDQSKLVTEVLFAVA